MLIKKNVKCYNRKIKCILAFISLMPLIGVAKYFDLNLFYNCFKEDFGAKQSIPIEIFHIKILASESVSSHFLLSRKIQENVHLHQRSLEYLYPLKELSYSYAEGMKIGTKEDQNLNDPIYFYAFSDEEKKVGCLKIRSINNISKYICKSV